MVRLLSTRQKLDLKLCSCLTFQSVCLNIKLYTNGAVGGYLREAYLSIQEAVKDGNHEALKTREDANMTNHTNTSANLQKSFWLVALTSLWLKPGCVGMFGVKRVQEWRCSAHLEGSEPQFKHQTLPLAHVLGGEGEDRVVDSEQRDQQQCGSSQPPGNTGIDQVSSAIRICPGQWSQISQYFLSPITFIFGSKHYNQTTSYFCSCLDTCPGKNTHR